MLPKQNKGLYGNYVLTVDGEQRRPQMTQKRKKTPQNAYYFYMQDFREQQEAKGIFYRSQKEVADAAHLSWKRLSDEERKPYKDAAKEAKEKNKDDLHNKFTTEGKSYAQVNREELELRQIHEKMLNEIRGTVRSLRTSPSLINYPFHLIHVNYYCKTGAGIYLPCELAVSEFTLLDGLKMSFHVLINPGELPLGYKYEAEKHSEETHKIPLPNEFQFKDVIRDYAKIFQCLLKFLRKAKAEYKLPPLYTVDSQIEPCESILTKLCESVNEENMFRVYPAKEVFFELQHMCMDVFKPQNSNAVKLPFSSLAERELEKDIFDYTKGISCSFHEETDAIPYCSLSCVRRWSFLILDYCHQITNMPLIPGKHVPQHTNVSQFRKIKMSVQQRKDDVQKLNAAMQSFQIKSNESAAHSEAQPDDWNMRQQQGPAVALSGALRPPKQVSEAIDLLSPVESDEEYPPLGS